MADPAQAISCFTEFMEGSSCAERKMGKTTPWDLFVMACMRRRIAQPPNVSLRVERKPVVYHMITELTAGSSYAERKMGKAASQDLFFMACMQRLRLNTQPPNVSMRRVHLVS